jgi:hypothetical protein
MYKTTMYFFILLVFKRVSPDTNMPQCENYDACYHHKCHTSHHSHCEDHPPPAVTRTCHCKAGYGYYSDSAGCVNIDVCEDAQYNFNNCGANTNCVDIDGGEVGFGGKTW